MGTLVAIAFIVLVVIAFVMKFKGAAEEEQELSELMQELAQKPLDARFHSHFLSQLHGMKYLSTNSSVSQPVYERALSILASNPQSTDAKVFALEVGRWHFGRVRKEGKVTVYDEQAIQNDILTRTR